jgi:hypothetical protein
MSSDCKAMREEIASMIAGGPPEHDAGPLREHLDSCASCRDYLRALQQEDAALTGHFAAVEGDMVRREERLRQAIERADTSEQKNRGFIWRGFMSNRLPRIALAAAVLLATAVGIQHFGGHLDGTSVAWADVAEKLSHINDYVYRERNIQSIGARTPGFELKDEYETWWYYSGEFGSRWDQYQNKELIGQYYILQKQQESVWVHSRDKTFCCRPQELPQTASLDPTRRIREVLAGPYVKLGRTTIDGVLVEGIEVQGQKVGCARLDDAVSRLWVNVETELPVWLESEGKMYGSDVCSRQIQDQFRWNVNLTEADFTPVLPADFVQKDWPGKDTPRADFALAAAQKDVVLDFRPLQELGLLSDDQVPAPPVITVTGIKEINAARDEVMSRWPKYADLRDSLRQELDQKLTLESCSVDRLVQLGVLLREKYWDVGGDFSATSYRYGYMARVLLEIAHAREPNDLAVGDELAEAIMATQTTASGPDFWPVLTPLRAAQFRQVRAEVDEGRPPVWEDFARVDDLVYLYSEPADRVPVIEWLVEHAQAGGWTGYLRLLEWMQAHAEHGHLGYLIYTAAGSKYPEEFRYGGRLPSFKGPRKRAVVPSYPLQPGSAQTEK